MQTLLLYFFGGIALVLAVLLGTELSDFHGLTQVFDIFKTPAIAEALALAILLGGFVSGYLYWIEAGKWRNAIQAAIADLRERAPNAESFAIAVESYSQFLESNCQLISHAWTEFEKTLLKPESKSAVTVIRSTARPTSYFNINVLIDSGFRLPFWQALPNYFVGFGLLCTFLGLVSGLYFAAQGVASPIPETARKALEDLLHAATFKFLTSIAGVLASLGLSIFIRSQTQILQLRVDDFCRLLEERLILVTPESLAALQLREQEKLTTEIQSFRTDFAVQLADALNQRMTNSEGKNVIVAAVEELRKTIEGMSGGMTAGITKGMETPLKSLSDGLVQLTEATDGAVKRLIEFSTIYSERITRASERFEEGIVRAANDIRAAATAATQALLTGAKETGSALAGQGVEAGKAIGEAGVRFNEIIQPLQMSVASLEAALARIAETFNGYHERTEQMKVGMDQSILGLREVVGGFERTGATLQSTAQPVREAADALTKASEQSAQSALTLQTLMTNANQLVEAIAGTQSKLQQAWEEYRNRFEDTDVHLTKTFQSLIDGVGQVEDVVQKFVADLDTHFSHALGTLNGGIQELKEAVENLNDTNRPK